MTEQHANLLLNQERIGEIFMVLAAIITGFVLWGCYANSSTDNSVLTKKRMVMVERQIAARGIKNLRVLEALRKVERHRFVPESLIPHAYDDNPLPIGENQTISQPYIVALMTELIQPKETDKILEIGTGSGYQAAILGELAQSVFTIEIVEALGRQAKNRLDDLDYKNIQVRIGDGYRGWPEKAPFDGIIVTAAPDHIPQPLVDQLKVGGRMVIPLGSVDQDLLLITKKEKGITKETIIPVRFVPMTGEAEKR